MKLGTTDHVAMNDFNREADLKFLHLKLIIAGGRDFSDYELLTKEADLFIADRETLIISGAAPEGADPLGERYAKERDLLLERYPAEWEKYGRSAGPRRNRVMASVATHLLAFWDGQSRGTKSMIEQAKSFNLVTRVITYRKTEKGKMTNK